MYEEFTVNSGFVVTKTSHSFSKMVIGQAQHSEQNNAAMKGDGGVVGIIEDHAALRQWMLSVPELEASAEPTIDNKVHCHHDQTTNGQTAFLKDVSSLKAAIQEYGNPICEDGSNLLALDTRDVCHETAVDSVWNTEELDQSQYNAFVKERLSDCTMDSLSS